MHNRSSSSTIRQRTIASVFLRSQFAHHIYLKVILRVHKNSKTAKHFSEPPDMKVYFFLITDEIYDILNLKIHVAKRRSRITCITCLNTWLYGLSLPDVILKVKFQWQIKISLAGVRKGMKMSLKVSDPLPLKKILFILNSLK